MSETSVISSIAAAQRGLTMSTASVLGLNSTFNPATIPLISSSIGLFYAFVEPTIFAPFFASHRTHPKETERTVANWWYHFLPLGLVTIFSIAIGNIVGGVYTMRSLSRDTQEWKVAAAGVGFATGHFLFVPKIAAVIQNIYDEDLCKKGETMKWLREWLRVHVWRTALMDVPAFACFAWLVFGSKA